jgi:fibronectin type 3 domain-containing protein
MLMRRLCTAALVLLLCLGPQAQAEDVNERDESRGPGILVEDTAWADSFDDMSKVHRLADVGVSGGEVRLEHGKDEGWIASSIVTCPEGFRYDLVLLEAEVPGNSSIKVSILDPAKPSSSGDFANATIAGFVNISRTDVSLTRLNWSAHPSIRVQATLVASGADRPMLMSWSVRFVDLGEWRDDFLGTGKMLQEFGINVTNGTIEADLSRRSGKFDLYLPFPPIMTPRGGTTTGRCPAFYANAKRTNYENVPWFEHKGPRDGGFADLDGDGYLDMVCGSWNNDTQGNPKDSYIFWGAGTERWNAIGATPLKAEKAMKVGLGDFNGDGEVDIAFACDPIGFTSAGSCVFLNQGGGNFTHQPTITFNQKYYRHIDTGDLNNDGYDDILFSCSTSQMDVYYGGPNGPDKIRDISFQVYHHNGPRIGDVNNDGFLDIVKNDNEARVHVVEVFLGGKNGPDTTGDIKLSMPGTRLGVVGIGDINSDGYNEIIATGEIDGSPYSPIIFKGGPAGFNVNNYHRCQWEGEPTTKNLEIHDINQDGYDDVVCVSGNIPLGNHLFVYLGGETWPTNPDVKVDDGNANYIAVAIPEVGNDGNVGRFTTEAITLPQGKKWDIVDLDGTPQENTKLTLSVLDESGKPIDGYKDLTDWNLDISDITERTIHIKVRFTVKSNGTTPVLDRLLVNWMDEWEWREQFYGEAKFWSREGLALRDDELQRSEAVGGPANGSYLSKAFGPEVVRDADYFHTLRYTARLGQSQSGKIHLLDATTLEVLAQTQLKSGAHVWSLKGAFSLKEHQSIQINVTAEGLDEAGEFALDDLWINWTERILRAPEVLDLQLSDISVYRTKSVELRVNVTDEYDDLEHLTVKVEHQLAGETEWMDYLIGPDGIKDRWKTFTIAPKYNDPLGIYRFRASVTDLDGNTSGFVEFPATLEVLPNRPSEPLFLVATAGDAQVGLEWRSPVDHGDKALMGYRIHRGLAEDSLALHTSVDFFPTSYVDTGLENGVTYYYAVLAFNEFGDGPLSEVVDATPLGLPSEPLNLYADASDGQVTLSWEAPEQDGGTPVLNYALYRGLSETSIGFVLQVDGTTYTDTGLLNGETYYYKVAAHNMIGEGFLSALVSAIPLAPPDAPRELSIDAGTGQVTLQWLRPLETGGASITSYRVYRGEDPDEHVLIKELGPTVPRYTDVDIVGGVTYFYKVTAVTVGGEGPASEVVPGMPLGPPGPPMALVAKAEDGKITLTWSAPENDGGSALAGYVIFRGTAEASLAEIARLGIMLSYVDTGLENGKTYYYSVAAYNEVGDGPSCEVVSGAPFRIPTVPGVPTLLKAKVEGEKVTLTWVAPLDDGGSPLIGYIVLRGTSKDDLQVVTELGVLVSFTDEGLKRGTTYYYSICAKNEVGQGERSQVHEVEVKQKEETSSMIGPGLIVAAVLAIILIIAAVLARLKFFKDR